MNNNHEGNRNYLGSVVCRYCEEIVDFIDAEKVMIYYSQCGDHKCSQNNRFKNDGYGETRKA